MLEEGSEKIVQSSFPFVVIDFTHLPLIHQNRKIGGGRTINNHIQWELRDCGTTLSASKYNITDCLVIGAS
jgi:hypothetical protein